MVPQDEINEQLELLATYRRTLAVYLRQQAALGEAYSPPGLVNGIHETRHQIQRIKQWLQAAGAAVPDDPDDEEGEPVPAGTDGLRVQTDQLTDVQTQDVTDALKKTYDTDTVDDSFIGASWGADITRQALLGLGIFLALAALLMAIYFRTWKMSAAAMFALLHDLLITIGVYAATGFEITPAAVIGFLTILGFSLYDTVVVFDKVRENTSEMGEDSTRTFGETVNLAVNQTLVRSINTGVVAALPVAAILFLGSFVLGADTLRDISLALLVGTLIGTYSTPFVASPFYSLLREREPAIRDRDKKTLTQRAKSLARASA